MIKQNLNLVVIMLFILIGVLLVNNIALTEKITARVIENLKRDYVPGPYDPGFDPDKVPPQSK
jgi:hypothetical protein